jgi:hypothetical protein
MARRMAGAEANSICSINSSSSCHRSISPAAGAGRRNASSTLPQSTPAPVIDSSAAQVLAPSSSREAKDARLRRAAGAAARRWRRSAASAGVTAAGPARKAIMWTSAKRLPTICSGKSIALGGRVGWVRNGNASHTKPLPTVTLTSASLSAATGLDSPPARMSAIARGRSGPGVVGGSTTLALPSLDDATTHTRSAPPEGVSRRACPKTSDADRCSLRRVVPKSSDVA